MDPTGPRRAGGRGYGSYHAQNMGKQTGRASADFHLQSRSSTPQSGGAGRQAAAGAGYQPGATGSHGAAGAFANPFAEAAGQWGGGAAAAQGPYGAGPYDPTPPADPELERLLLGPDDDDAQSEDMGISAEDYREMADFLDDSGSSNTQAAASAGYQPGAAGSHGAAGAVANPFAEALSMGPQVPSGAAPAPGPQSYMPAASMPGLSPQESFLRQHVDPVVLTDLRHDSSTSVDIPTRYNGVVNTVPLTKGRILAVLEAAAQIRTGQGKGSDGRKSLSKFIRHIPHRIIQFAPGDLEKFRSADETKNNSLQPSKLKYQIASSILKSYAPTMSRRMTRSGPRTAGGALRPEMPPYAVLADKPWHAKLLPGKAAALACADDQALFPIPTQKVPAGHINLTRREIAIALHAMDTTDPSVEFTVNRNAACRNAAVSALNSVKTEQWQALRDAFRGSTDQKTALLRSLVTDIAKLFAPTTYYRDGGGSSQG